MSWFRRDKPKIEGQSKGEDQTVKTEGIFVKCSECDTALYKRELKDSNHVCIHCGYHLRLGARERLELLFDDGAYEELDEEVVSGDPLDFVDSKPYKDRIKEAQKKSGLPEAIISGKGLVGGHKVYAGAMDMSFIGGSMGSAVGEKITRLIERALKTNGAVIVFSASGGARMQEGTLSLMQMAKISVALAKLHDKGLPFISILTDPTTGGVTASFAMLGDVILAEPKALIGFAGPRVIEQTIRQKLPKGFQRSEFLLEHGMLDMVVDRREMKETIVRLLDFMMKKDD
ncbi:MAG: acetyl-CoA carboxylase carboxyltransferase subunit beta [Acidobacteria bacterium]|nr:MAG: acetyl-CoA carboxylase carboxyltransferase subunit beta [Acidobacteriota bacterium]REK01837.1 MAG: acetyl-CoA carboxylase carboxyltransferase subunit beta [Acidobacteriota bacterium]REK14793.1 MAG: acetyl-CoA carboxylase carboxyltransferase subunit beta [Acidobacteriota bacterium]REK45508.1 MAG: acetyl-CoA carboxylase carboxyltransferase subunit beta [Acidobacteriota bacterium]